MNSPECYKNKFSKTEPQCPNRGVWKSNVDEPPGQLVNHWTWCDEHAPKSRRVRIGDPS